MRLVTWLVIAPLLLGSASAEEANVLTDRTSLTVEFFKHKEDEFIGQGDVDNRWEIFDPVVKIKPPISLGHCPGNELILIIYGESILNKKNHKIFFRGGTKLDLKGGQEFVWQGKQVKIEYDPHYPSESQSYVYDGSLIVIKNAKGEIAFTKSSKPKWQKCVDKFLAAEVDKVYSDDYFSRKEGQIK